LQLKLNKKFMKKILYIFFLFSFYFVSTMQGQNSRNSQTTTQNSNEHELKNLVNDCPDLKAQLVKLFGENFQISSEKVQSQLINNISNKQLNRCIRKSSLKIVYGKDYINKLNLIETQSKTN